MRKNGLAKKEEKNCNFRCIRNARVCNLGSVTLRDSGHVIAPRETPCIPSADFDNPAGTVIKVLLTRDLLAIAGCRYEGRRYQEGTAVGTSEPCLQCRCTEGALRCRLRVCPRLPNPPPPGCHVRSPAENVCCAELICGESR